LTDRGEDPAENGNAFFHMTDGDACIRMVKKLSIMDGRGLHGFIRQLQTIEARRIVANFLEMPAFPEKTDDKPLVQKAWRAP